MKKAIQTSPLFRYWINSYLLVLLCFAPFLCMFTWGNHDWDWIRYGTPLLSGLFEGRFSQFILPTILFSGQILPLLSLATALALYTLAAIMLCRLWKIPQKQYFYLLLTISLTAAPYTLSWLYFAFLTLSNLFWPLVIIIAFTIVCNHNLKLKLRLLLSIILLTLALGGYPPVINLMGILYLTLILNDLCLQRLTPKSLVRKYWPHLCAIVSAIILILITQYFLKKYGLQVATYNTAEITLSELPAKLLLSLKESLEQFVITTNFIDGPYKFINLFICLLGLVRLYALLPKKASTIILFSSLVIAILLASVTTTLLAQNTAYILHEPRIKFYTLPYITAFSAIVLWHSRHLLIRNLTSALLLYLIFSNYNTIAHAAKIWKNGFIAETNYMQRFLSRLEDLPNFTPQTKHYTFIQGGNLNLRARYTHERPIKTDSYTLSAPYIPWHLPSKAYTFYYPQNFISKDFDTYWHLPQKQQLPLTPEVAEYLLHNAMAWPHQQALYSANQLLILTLTPEGKGWAQQWLHKN
ncbi:glucosyltransferase domain-containing protein [bacterium]|nr:glucosyltransferase domain-containing protein [bacterium]MBR2273886.1 glucosyltransferase domain-containing protein [Alphaproteobacteria bacterium]